eukprot:CAMPEP_0196792614 /NCGR_PEP_ID=MMETSP1104-20130614/31726_1 /TAXON_ID=33652 /ORGANISM="Cafeteria sp., Strain Caron Lab Isolate" /LENGTH=259 /DNA_ID=CAMNT_0042162981 /DNA_START=79 /DNA_END=854 /DNA_ORIENTATION=-
MSRYPSYPPDPGPPRTMDSHGDAAAANDLAAQLRMLSDAIRTDPRSGPPDRQMHAPPAYERDARPDYGGGAPAHRDPYAPPYGSGGGPLPPQPRPGYGPPGAPPFPPQQHDRYGGMPPGMPPPPLGGPGPGQGPPGYPPSYMPGGPPPPRSGGPPPSSGPRRNPTPSLWVAMDGLPRGAHTFSEGELRGLFERFGRVDSVAVSDRGFAFVNFADERDAMNAHDRMGGAQHAGGVLKVAFAKAARSRNPPPISSRDQGSV